MSKLKLIPVWGWAAAILLLAALVFRFALRGYSYIAYTLTFIAALILLHQFLPVLLWRILVVLVCIGFVYFCIVEVPIIKNARTDEDAERPYLVVLGAAVHGDDASLSLVHRLRGVLDYMEQYPDCVAIVSGGQGKGENMTEAKCMYDWLTAHGIEGSRIIMEDRATSTAENLAFSFDIIRSLGVEPDGNTAILSSPYHLFRAKSMARSMGVEAAGVAGHWDYPILTINYFIREAFGVTHMWAFGW
ncbi:MAG: YdcF family protein [Clostridiales bacterium]|nr:YdcF family protein [Clostridiales bacterium]